MTTRIEQKKMDATEEKAAEPTSPAAAFAKNIVQEALQAAAKANELRRQMAEEALGAKKEVVQIRVELQEERSRTEAAQKQLEELQASLSNIQRELERAVAINRAQSQRIQSLEQQNQLAAEQMQNLHKQIEALSQLEKLLGAQILGLRSQIEEAQAERHRMIEENRIREDDHRCQLEEVARRAYEAAQLQLHRERTFDRLVQELEDLRDRYQREATKIFAQASGVCWGTIAAIGPLGFLVGPVAGLGFLAAHDETPEMRSMRERAELIIPQIVELCRLLNRPSPNPQSLEIREPAQKQRMGEND